MDKNCSTFTEELWGFFETAAFVWVEIRILIAQTHNLETINKKLIAGRIEATLHLSDSWGTQNEQSTKDIKNKVKIMYVKVITTGGHTFC